MKAIHDRYYATPPSDWSEYRWRLQMLSEEHVGSAVRRGGAAEDAAWQAAVGRVSDAPR